MLPSVKLDEPSETVTGVSFVIFTWQSDEFGYAPLDQLDASFQFPLEPPIQYTSVNADAARTVMDAKQEQLDAWLAAKGE